MMMVDSLDYGGEGGLVIGRGDSPALAVLDRNARSLAQRVADETKEELEKVLKRVENIYGNFEVSNNLLESTRAANLEYVNDVSELEELIRDQVKKKKYQQQVTIFIVGFENVCGQKLRLLQQVNEFFMDNAQKLDDDDIRIKSPDLDLDDMAETVEETLKTTEDLAKRLGELNKEMMEYMYNYAQAKASNKGKKKLEKALTQAKDDINTLNEKLLNLQQEIEEKEDKMQQMFKQVEMKNMEVQRYKTAAEVAKKSHEETDKLREEISVRDEKIKVLIKEIEKLQQELALSHHTKERSQERLLGAREESNTKLEQLQQSMQDQTLLAEEAKRDLARLHKKQIDGLETAHKEEIVQLQLQHNEEIKKLLDQIEIYKERIDAAQKAMNTAEAANILASERSVSADIARKKAGEEASKAALYEIDGQGSLSTDSRSESKASSVKPVSRHETRSSTKSVSRKPSGASSTVRQESRQQNQEEAEVAPGVEPERPREEPVKPPAQPPLVPVTEDEILEFDNVYPLEDEEAWAHVPPEEVRGRFGQYRKLSQQELDKLREQVDTTIKRASKKINTLKGQFQEHKAKWDSERLLLKSQIQQVSKLQNAAENEADKAMNQLEDFINEQEKLEVEEEEKRKALEQMAKVAAGSKSEAAGRDGAAKTEDAASAPIVEHEAMQQRLLEQTDDAKMEMSRKASAKQVTSDTQTDEQIDTGTEANLGNTAEGIRASSARSRASLRSQQRSALNAMRTAQEERRTITRTPTHHSINKSSLTDAELDEDGDMPFPKDKPALTLDKVSSSHDIGTSMSHHEQSTSPMTPQPLPTKSPSLHDDLASRDGIAMADHPVVEEYIKTYENIVNFKDVLAKTFLERDLMSPGSVLSDIEPVPFHKDNTVQPQLELMTDSVQKILQEILNLVKNILAADRDYPVSSLNLSREQTRLTRFTPDSAYGGGGTQARKTAAPGVPEPDPKTQQQIEELQKMCKMMEKNLNTESKKYEERLQHNTVVMMEMQDTINALQRELSALKAAQERQAAQEIPEDSPIMFTRLDSERNAKVMKRALNERRLSYETYETAVRSMSKYVSLPAKRLAHLVTKYVHHRQMKEIEERVQKSRSVDQDVFHVLDKMEMLQSVRAHRWADRMDAIGAERLRLAAVLMETLGEIERESGIFLIKPVFSYKPRYDPDKYDGKISRRFKPAQDGAGLVQQATSTTTPASHIRTVQQLQNQSLPSDLYSQIQREEESNIIEGKTKNLIGEYPKPVWQPSAAITHQANENNTHRFNSHLNTPKMLELDINRMLIGHNQIVMRTTPGMESDDRLANAANQTTRSYITVHRPSGHPTAVPATRPRSHPGGADPSVPPTTPYTKSLPSSAGRKARVPEDGGARPLNSTPPLPPITPTLERPLSREVMTDDDLLPPRSPPGSSMRQSTAPAQANTPFASRPNTQSGVQEVQH